MELPSLDSQDVVDFMSKVSTELNVKFPDPSTIISFGSSLPHLIPKMNALTLSGVKRAMAGFPTSSTHIPGDYFIAVDETFKPAILLHVLTQFSVPFESVTSKFVFEEGHPEMTIQTWRDWHQKFWEQKLDHDGTPFGDGVGKKVMNMIYKVVYPVPRATIPNSTPVTAFLDLIEHSMGFGIPCGHVKGVFDFGGGIRHVTKKLNSQAIKDSKVILTNFSAPGMRVDRDPGDHLVGLGEFGEPYILLKMTSLELKSTNELKKDSIFVANTISHWRWNDGSETVWKETTDSPRGRRESTSRNVVRHERYEIVWPKGEEVFP